MPTYEIVDVADGVYALRDIETGHSAFATNVGDESPVVGEVVTGAIVGEGADAMVQLSAGLGRLVYPTAPGATGKRWVTAGEFELKLKQVGLVSVEHAPILCTGSRPFVLSDPTVAPAGFWPLIPDVAEWERELTAVENIAKAEIQQIQRVEAVAAQKVLDIAAAVEGAPAYLAGLNQKFVNPYTFVPWPLGDIPAPQEEPVGHEALLPGRFSGALKVSGTTLTPLLIRGGTAPNTFPRRKRRKDDGSVSEELVIGGSGLKGAIRSLHETLAGGCLRVVATDFSPVYRETPVVKDATWTMAVVDQIDDYGIPATVTLCDEVVHVNQEHLCVVLGGAANVVTGARVDINLTDTYLVRTARRAQDTGVSVGNDWVVLMTDSAARQFNQHPNYYAAVGRLSGSQAEVTIEAWERYEKAVSGARDNSTSHLTLPPAAPVHWPPNNHSPVIGTRTRARHDLHPGDVIWVEVSGANTPSPKVERINRSYLWRVQGEGNLGTRIPDWAKPCVHAQQLCVSCRLFGSADTEATHSQEQAEQESYAGHVRIGDATFAPATTTELVQLGPLGEPRLGAGQFSLQNRRGARRAANREAKPLRNWGSALDLPEPARLLRGRKFYWQGDPARQNPPRYLPYAHGQGAHNMEDQAEIVPAGNTYSTTVHFENLCLAQLGALAASIDPSLVLAAKRPTVELTDVAIPNTENPTIAGRIGGGKPFGFGAVATKVELISVHTDESRYLGGADPVVDLHTAVEAFMESVPEAVKDTWPDIAACLQMHHVDPTKIAYPPAAAWGTPHRAAYAKEFWKQSSGAFNSDLVSLPGPPRNADQYLTIVSN